MMIASVLLLSSLLLGGAADTESFPANLSAPRPVTADTFTDEGGIRQVLGSSTARPLSLASADFDEDGMPDLVCGYADGSRGLIVVHRGNVRAWFTGLPGGPYTADRPFPGTSRGFGLDAPPDFLVADDFDGDGHADLVAGARGGEVLPLRAGTGSGEFAPARSLTLTRARCCSTRSKGAARPSMRVAVRAPAAPTRSRSSMVASSSRPRAVKSRPRWTGWATRPTPGSPAWRACVRPVR